MLLICEQLWFGFGLLSPLSVSILYLIARCTTYKCSLIHALGSPLSVHAKNPSCGVVCFDLSHSGYYKVTVCKSLEPQIIIFAWLTATSAAALGQLHDRKQLNDIFRPVNFETPSYPIYFPYTHHVNRHTTKNRPKSKNIYRTLCA